jgi:hypothetical protein
MPRSNVDPSVIDTIQRRAGSVTLDPLLRGKQQADDAMFYRASYLSNNHLDLFSLRFVGNAGITVALTYPPPNLYRARSVRDHLV